MDIGNADFYEPPTPAPHSPVMKRPRLPEPRRFVTTALIWGAVSGLSWSCLFSLYMQEDLATILFPGGLIVGLFLGLFIAFFLRGMTATVDVQNPATFVSRLEAATAQQGYYPASRTDEIFIFKPALRTGFLAGRLAVRIDAKTATMVGPKVHVARLQKRLSEKLPEESRSSGDPRG
jgi:hypothetical protein